MRLLLVLVIVATAAIASMLVFRPLTGDALSAIWVGLALLLMVACTFGARVGAGPRGAMRW